MIGGLSLLVSSGPAAWNQSVDRASLYSGVVDLSMENEDIAATTLSLYLFYLRTNAIEHYRHATN